MNLNKKNNQHNKRVERHAQKVEKLYFKFVDKLVKEINLKGLTIPRDEIFSFNKNPRAKKIADKLFKEFSRDLESSIKDSMATEWGLSEDKNMALVKEISKRFPFPETALQQYYARNTGALRAFQQRKVGGLDLSDRVWNYSNQYREQIELALDYGIGKGDSAQKIARNVKAYLKEPDMLFRRVRNERNELVLSKRAKSYNPGQGTYRSSYKNAIRLARTEINMAYHKSDSEKYKQFDFILGIEVRLSNTHDINGCDLCDRLKGLYPVWFIFIGWHPQCKCATVPIMKSIEDMFIDEKRKKEGKPLLKRNVIKEVPNPMKDWLKENSDKMRSKKAPWIYKENEKKLSQYLS